MRGLLVLALLGAMVVPAQARTMTLTIYDDGISCPAGCDAHVVMNAADNGTRNAYRPGSTRAAPAPCRAGDACVICFGDGDGTCMTAVYRGGGPPVGMFDFTPAFYGETCGKPGIPAALAAQCKVLDGAVRSLGYDKRTNCFATPASAACGGVLAAARAAQDADIPKRLMCLAMGETAYNAAQRDPAERRANACNYTDLRSGGSPGRRWRKLLPAACRPGTYVDRFGLDCCSSDIRFAASNHPECVAFFPR